MSPVRKAKRQTQTTGPVREKRRAHDGPEGASQAGRLPASTLFLQRYLGNSRMQPPLVQAKLIVGQPDDRYEREADRVADAVMRMPDPRLQRQVGLEEEEEELIQAKPLAEQITPLVQRQTEPGEEEEELIEEEEEEQPIQAKLTGGVQMQRLDEELEEEEEEPIQAKRVREGSPQVGPSLETQINALRRGGQSLDPTTRSFMEPRFGHDFSQVRIHTGSRAAKTAQALNACAFTIGRDIVFGTGQRALGASAGQRLLAHELTHVVQQSDNELRSKFAPSELGGGSARGWDLTALPIIQCQKGLTDTGADKRETSLWVNEQKLMRSIRKRMGSRYWRIASYVALGDKITDNLVKQFNRYAADYEEAYGKYARVLEQAGQTAQKQERWKNVVISFAASALVALGGWAVLPELTALSHGIAASIGGALTSTTLAEVTSRATSSARTGPKPAKDLDPNALRAKAWKYVYTFSKHVHSVGNLRDVMFGLNNIAHYALTEVSARVAGKGTMSEDELFLILTKLETYDALLEEKLDKKLSKATDCLRKLKRQLLPLRSYGVRRMQQDIWILWMRRLEDSDILDLDPIEEHLEEMKVINPTIFGIGIPIGRLNVSFGLYTTKEATKKALALAKKEAGRLEKDYLRW